MDPVLCYLTSVRALLMDENLCKVFEDVSELEDIVLDKRFVLHKYTGKRYKFSVDFKGILEHKFYAAISLAALDEFGAMTATDKLSALYAFYSFIRLVFNFNRRDEFITRLMSIVDNYRTLSIQVRLIDIDVAAIEKIPESEEFMLKQAIALRDQQISICRHALGFREEEIQVLREKLTLAESYALGVSAALNANS